ncbi:MAG: polymer-forming cytoskeletal protein [Deinococcus sp.]|uniref:polymer-forming cytoskeletal protein n=1 Tax=Deinococcus sp. TaxID=47478 RepID=UPI0026DA9194|nr:polymer-forming cytoskeletal protein [Deinococcus sp.]MDO4247175.1 polymer-forming cytoskeletal protein [Deinococcus sp.]
MGVSSRQELFQVHRASAAQLELLHREADGDLSPAEQAALGEALRDPDVQAARDALERSVALLLQPPPPAGRSVAPAVLKDLRLSRHLTAVPPPVTAQSVAAQVSRDIALVRRLEQAAPPPLPTSVAPAVVADIRMARHLAAPPAPPLGAGLAARIAQEADHNLRDLLRQSPVPFAPSLAPELAARIALEAAPSQAAFQPVPVSPAYNPAPLLLVGGLLAGLTLLTVTSAWPNLHAGALVLQTVLEHIAPMTALGLLLLLATSALVTLKPVPAVRRFGTAAFVLAGVLTMPPLYQAAQGGPGLSFGQPVVVRGEVPGNIVSIGGDVTLEADARVQGRVVTVLGDIKQAPGATVAGETSALLGRAPGETADVLPSQGVGLATAAAFRPLMGWLGAAAWPQIFVTMTGGLLLLLFVAGTAPVLARRQRHAPMRTLALGILMLSALLLPAVALGLGGLLAPSLLMLALVSLLIATGLSVSVYDAGRALACRLRLPVPDTVGAFLGLSALAASLSLPPLAFALALVGGAWGAGTLFLYRQDNRI